MEPMEAEEGRVRFAVEPSERHYDVSGAVHSGLAAALLIQ